MAHRSVWRGFAFRGLSNQLVCLAIAVLIHALGGDKGGFATVWIYSVCIGTSCWLFIDGGRLLLAAALTRGNPAGETLGRWPSAVVMLLCIVLGTLAGYSLGVSIADRLTGRHTPGLLQNAGTVVISLMVAVAATAYFYARERLHQANAAAEAARRLASENQLRLLQSQLEPHMLFNTLANLRVLITLDPPRAQAMLDRLIGFLRATLSASQQDLHPLSAEFDRLADYLALMAVRMGPRLAVALDLPVELRRLPVPPLLLQPLVENAIQHGLEPQVAGGRLTVRASAQAGQLVLTVQDDGVGLATSGQPAGQAQGRGTAGGGYGTQHVQQRLAALYGAAARFSLSPAPGGGALAALRLPLPPDQAKAATQASPDTAGHASPHQPQT